MNRSYEVSDDDHQPLTWVQGRPLFVVHAIVVGLAFTILATALLQAFGAFATLNHLVFDSVEVLSGEVWRVLTYGLVNGPSVGIALDLALLLWFGHDVERLLGRRSFLRLYAFIYFIPPLLLSALGIWHPIALAGQTGALAVFVAYATLNPTATVCLNILASWAAVILVAVFTLMALADHNWGGLVALWGTTAYAYAFARHAQGHFSVSMPRLRRTRPAEPARAPAPAAVRIGPARAPARAAAPVPRTDAEMAEVDALLDKINRSGLESLTPVEHERLSAAQARLARRYEHR
jgi:membrane associated rhomboid family serine protease